MIKFTSVSQLLLKRRQFCARAQVPKKLRERNESWEDLNSEIDGAIRDIRRGVGVDNRERLRANA